MKALKKYRRTLTALLLAAALTLSLGSCFGSGDYHRHETADPDEGAEPCAPESPINELEAFDTGINDPAVPDDTDVPPESEAPAPETDAPSEPPAATETEPAETEPAETEPAETEPAETEPAETEPAETEPPKAPEKTADVRVTELLASMSLEEKVGQLLLARCPTDGAENMVTKYAPGGLVMFAANYEGKTPAASSKEVKQLNAASKIPLLIAADEEGGTVTRLSRYKAFRASKFLAPRALFAQGGFDLIESDTAEKCNMLRSAGVNVNLAPVCDISTNPDDFMYDRSLGEDAATTSKYIDLVVSVMCDKNIGCSLKHFPGYGSCGDTHTEIITDIRSYDEFVTKDFLPFKAGIDAGAGSVMVSHNIVTCIDKDYPASLSVKMHEILRNDLGFNGVIMTDDLSMNAISLYTDGATAAVRAIIAGNDMLCCSDYDVQYEAVLAAVKNGTITVERINESVTRILTWKADLGLI